MSFTQHKLSLSIVIEDLDLYVPHSVFLTMAIQTQTQGLDFALV